MIFLKMLIVLFVLCLLAKTYPLWGYHAYYERCEINSKHPNWYPKCAKNFFEEDPQWFVDNGYKEKLKQLGVKL